MATTEYKLHYEGSIFWLVFWLILFFPIALVLLFTGSGFKAAGKTYSFRYVGSRFWVCFWLVLFFPLAFVLMAANGLVMVADDTKI